jgi:hypothetical protein
MDFLAIKKCAKDWFERGLYHVRTESECAIYLMAAEDTAYSLEIPDAYVSALYKELNHYFDILRGEEE